MGNILKKMKEELSILVISEILCAMLLVLSIVLKVGWVSYALLALLFVLGFLNVFFPVWIWFGVFTFSLQVIALWNLTYRLAPSFVYIVMFFISVAAALALKFSTEVADDTETGITKESDIKKDRQEFFTSNVSDQFSKLSESSLQQGNSHFEELSYLDAEVKNSVLSSFDEVNQKHKSLLESCKNKENELTKVIDLISNVYSELLNIFTSFSSHQNKFKEIQLFVQNSISKVSQEIERLQGSDIAELKLEEKGGGKISYDYREIQDEAGRFADIVGKLSSYFENLEIKKVYDSTNSLLSILSFLKLLANEVRGVINGSFSVSLKIMQMSSSSEDIGVRRSLMVILQDMDSILFKFSIYIKNFYDAVYDFSFYLEDFMSKITDIEKNVKEVERFLSSVKITWKNAVQPKIPLFVEKIEQLATLQSNTEIIEDLSRTSSKSKEFFSDLERFSEWVGMVNSETAKITPISENILNDISELLRGFYAIKSEFEKLLSEIRSIQSKLPYISEYDLTSPRLVKDIAKLVSSMGNIEM